MKLKRRWKWRLRKLLLWVLILALALLKYSWPLYINLKDPLVLDIPKCPACYGENLCPQFLKGNIFLTNWTRVTLLSKLFNAKNTYYGQYGDTQVILKKLAHSQELDKLDETFCQIVQRNKGCENVGRNIRIVSNLWMKNSVPQFQNIDFHEVKGKKSQNQSLF